MKPHSLEVLRKHAKMMGGELLSDSYKDCKHKMLWKCREGHQWESTWDCVKSNGSWCPSCVKKSKPELAILVAHAERKGGKLLSTRYLNNETPMKWECSEGHTWMAKWNNVHNNKWCPTCAGKKKPELAELQRYAIKKSGTLLSTTYKDTRSKLLWECRVGHQWPATWHDIKQGTWCPSCSSFKNEQICRAILESRLGFQLPKSRFTNNGNKYEWDGFNSVNQTAFEYHGEQHYKRHKFFHKSQSEFEGQLKRDEAKRLYAKENGITLIVIPFSCISDLQTLDLDLFVSRPV